MDEGTRHLHDRTHEEGLEWLGETISRHELLSANCLKVLPSERISLADVVAELSGMITNLKAIEAHLLAATQTIASPATPPSLPSTPYFAAYILYPDETLPIWTGVPDWCGS
ncbi:unnamed protein product [Vitrella brassicaformis CCMP3155]|uniref:Uncharacterized protein n=1 Tax=Vitrella brassicaformis (strain CCMP3155) TaxID=1169540 RepID=A0A0G4GXS2_VITBC|nr:unnamed protein product [Vitrella brassicaformis CCMP3155]|eukprot:CEM35902.1 unnamed protein product [Vitrella brassicaformis CCMP3155]